MKIEGTQKCNSKYKNCDNVYEWMVLLPNHINKSSFDVEILNKPMGTIIAQDENEYTIKVMCPKCIQDNIFQVKKHS